MDAFVQLALIEKSKRVFGADAGVMLSFPLLAPIGFTPAEMAALTAPVTSADYAAAADFARTVNFLPTDMVATMTERMLWDVYRDVLLRAEVGDVAASDGQAGQASAAAAADVLYQAGPDGIRVESEALKRYRQYRDAWIVAREDYAAHQLTGDMSQDPAERQRWTEVEEPVLRSAIDAASSAWDTLGGRVAVEQALQAQREAALRDPRRRWAEWTQAFNPDIDLMTEAGGSQYGPTGLSPRNFVEQDWLTFDLSASEMRTLVDEAPEALRGVLDGEGGAGIERVRFEYRSVALVRSWFRPEVLTSGIWRSSEAELQLSDGNDPPTGACPAYATACVFIRNVQVTQQQVPGTGGGGRALPDVHFTLDAARLTKRRNLLIDPGIAARISRRAVQPEVLAPPPAAAPLAFQILQRHSFLQVPVQKHFAALAVQPEMRLERIALAEPTTHVRLDLLHSADPVLAPADPALTPAPPAVPPPRDEISILAFICKRLPRMPDPALDLVWAGDKHPFPLPSGHTFGSPASEVIHDGKASEADRAAVLAIQGRLLERGQVVVVDGRLGKESVKAIRGFQQSRRLTGDGLVGPLTWRALWT